MSDTMKPTPIRVETWTTVDFEVVPRVVSGGRSKGRAGRRHRLIKAELPKAAGRRRAW
jgi:hypothetical protein